MGLRRQRPVMSSGCIRLGVGDHVPAFELPDPDDIMVSSAALLEKGSLIVTFYRGIWCPYCREDLKDLAHAAPKIRSCGASLVAIAHQAAPGSNGKFQREHRLEFPILDDR
jgi:peroxiredoxin